MSESKVGGLPPLPEWCLDDDRAAYVLAGMSGPQYRNDMQDYARAALSAHGQPVVDEDAQEAIADILNRMESWSKAYPVEVFHEPTKEERDWLHKTRPGLMDCIAASMGRHMAKRIADDLAKLTAALTGADHEH